MIAHLSDGTPHRFKLAQPTALQGFVAQKLELEYTDILYLRDLINRKPTDASTLLTSLLTRIPEGRIDGLSPPTPVL